MQRIRVKVAIRDDQQILQQIVEGAVELNESSMVLVPPALPPHDVLLVQPDRDERDTLDHGGKVLAIDGRPDGINLYELRSLGSVRWSSQLAMKIRELVQPLIGRRS
jgi:hypothetical protein